MQLWRLEFELVGINSDSAIVYQYECIIENERETVRQLCAKYYVAWK